MFKETEVIDKIKKLAEEILGKVGYITIIETNNYFEKKSSGSRLLQTDFSMKLKTKSGKRMTLIFEVKSNGQPRYIRNAVNQLKELMSREKNVYGIVGAGFLTEESRAICEKGGFGYLDTAGNCLFQFNGAYIRIEGKPNPYPSTRTLKSIFSPKSTRILRVLLCNPKRDWYVKDLSKEANVSLGQVFNVKNRLLEYEWIEITESGKMRLSDPQNLLLRWSENYRYTDNRIQYFYTLDDPAQFENRLIQYMSKINVNYALTLTSGAARIAPYLRYKKVFAYIEKNVNLILPELELKEVTSGANVMLLEPYDEGVFYGLQEVDNTKVVSNIQLYLDLKSYKERGDEAAEFIFRERIIKI
jgi:hypothetical protein